MAARRRAFGRTRRLLNIASAVLLGVAVAFVALFAYDGTQPAVSVLMVGRWIEGKPVDRQWTPLGDMSRHLVDSVVMSETASSASTTASTGSSCRT